MIDYNRLLHQCFRFIYTIDGIQLTAHDFVLESAFQILCLNNTYVTRDMLFYRM